MLEDMNNHDVRKYLPWMREQLFARLFLHSHIEEETVEEETVDLFEERILFRLFLDASSFVVEYPQGVSAEIPLMASLASMCTRQLNSLRNIRIKTQPRFSSPLATVVVRSRKGGRRV